MIVDQDYSIVFCLIPALMVAAALIHVWRS